MEKLNKTQNLPQTLELNEWLKLSLISSKEVTRQIALEELVSSGISSDFCSVLTYISEKDSSENCRSQAQWLLKLSETKKNLKYLIKKLDITPDFISLQLKKGEYAKISLFSQMLKKAPQIKTIELWRETLSKKNIENHLIQIGLDILTKFGVESDSIYAVNQLKNPNPDVLCSALTLLSKKNPELLKKNIKIGLTSKNANVVLHSIHLLKAIDEPEAIKYLSVLILNRNPLVRQKALRELTLITFDKVEEVFWHYISQEDQPLLLVKAGLLATFNPAPIFPFKICDIMQSTTGIKAHILQLVLKQCIATTNVTGVLGDKNINIYIDEIKKYISNKKAEQAIRVYIANLKATEVGIRADAVEKLSKFISNNQIKNLLEKQLTIETDDGIKSYLISLFEDSTEDDTPKTTISNQELSVSDSTNNSSNIIPIKTDSFILPSLDSCFNNTALKEEKDNTVDIEYESKNKSNQALILSFPKAENFIKLSAKEQKSLLKKITSIEEYSTHKNTLIELLDKDIKKTVLLEILKTIGIYGDSDDVRSIYHLTKSNDNSIIAQTIKSIGSIDIDSISPELNKFLAHDDPRIKSAAFEVYAIADKQAAIQYVGTMLNNTNVSIRRIGLSLIPLLDYPSAEPLLWWMLIYESNADLQKQVGYIVASNPTKEGIIKLFKFTHDKDGGLKEGFGEIWEVAVLSTANVFNLTKEQIETECWNSIVRAEQEERKEKPDYKFKSSVYANKNIASEIGEITNNISNDNLIENVFIHVFQFKYYYAIAVISFGVFLYMISDKDPNIIRRANKQTVVAESNFVPTEISDKTTQVGSEGWQDGMRSGARKILRSQAYSNLMKSAVQEQEAFREEAKRKEEAYYRNLANDSNADQEDREWAATKINENYQKGFKYFKLGNYKDAEYYLEKASNDTSLGSFARIEAIQKLMEISHLNNDKEAYFKWLDKMFKEVKNIDGFGQVKAFENFGKIISDMQNVSNQLKGNPQAREQYLENMKIKFKYSDEEAKTALNDIINFKFPFGN